MRRCAVYLLGAFLWGGPSVSLGMEPEYYGEYEPEPPPVQSEPAPPMHGEPPPPPTECRNTRPVRVQNVSAGMDYTCVETEFGTKCHGPLRPKIGYEGVVSFINDREFEFLGGSFPVPHGNETPYVRHSLRDVVQLEAGDHHTCARSRYGELVCWGENDSGQLGYGDTEARGFMKRTEGRVTDTMGEALKHISFDQESTYFKDVAVGGKHTCAIQELNTPKVRCWGNNSFGQLGISPKTETVGTTPVPNKTGIITPASPNIPSIIPGDHPVEVTAGAQHTCVRTKFGEVFCFGDNSHGQLGTGDTEPRNVRLDRVVRLSEKGVAEITAGAFHTCARTFEGEVKCWGSNEKGQLTLGEEEELGDPGKQRYRTQPVSIPIQEADAIEAGADHTCAVGDKGTWLACWGSNELGQLGPQLPKVSQPQVALPGIKVDRVSAGGGHTCIVTQDQSVFCWGYNHHAQCAEQEGRRANQSLPLTPTDFGTVSITTKPIAISGKHACVTLCDGHQVRCWGKNDFHSLGLDDSVKELGKTPDSVGDSLTTVRFPAPIKQIVMEDTANYFVLESGKVMAFGNGSYLKRVRDRIPREPIELDLGSELKVKSMASSSSNFSCALFENGKAKCWGLNNYGQLGGIASASRFGDLGDKLPFADIGSARIQQIAAGGQFACALFESKKVKCWGRNKYGQLGLGHKKNVVIGVDPIHTGDKLPYLNIPEVKQIVAGNTHACALLVNGGVKCWGENTHGQLGTLDTEHRGDAPEEMGNRSLMDLGGSKAIQVVVGLDDTCVLLEDRTMICYGYNLGKYPGGTAPKTPAKKRWRGYKYSDDKPSRIYLSYKNWCGYFPDDGGSFRCGGDNFYGQLGLGANFGRRWPHGRKGILYPAIFSGKAVSVYPRPAGVASQK